MCRISDHKYAPHIKQIQIESYERKPPDSIHKHRALKSKDDHKLLLDNGLYLSLDVEAAFLRVSDSELAVDGDVVHRGFVKDEIEAADDVG